MQQFLTDETPYSIPYMKKRLTEYFGDAIIIAEMNGKPDVVTMKNTAASILQDFYKLPQIEDIESEKIRFVTTAADLIKNDIKSVDIRKDLYPCPEEISSLEQNLAFIPESLHVLLKILFVGTDTKLKIASIGEAIMQSTRPRVLIAPLQIGLGVQMHHHFASKFLIDSLHRHGFSSSYTEVKQFESNAALTQGTDISGHGQGQFLQFIADNVDHNVRTLDGFNTFHGMGIVATSSPGGKGYRSVPRKLEKPSDITAIGRIGIHFYRSQWNAISSLKYHKLPNQSDVDRTSEVDLLWKISWSLRSPRPSWSGVMQTVHHGAHPGEASITFLPMIDMSPSDLSCIYSTLKFIAAQAKKYDVTPVVTFDQPLWWKAQTIIAGCPTDDNIRSTVLRLGAFHTTMSFLGCIGHLMGGSGLSEVLETIYAPNAVSHMLTGKATTRAIRAHFLLDTVLHSLVLTNAFDNPWVIDSGIHDQERPAAEDDITNSRKSHFIWTKPRHTMNDDLKEAADLFDKLMAGDISVAQVCEEGVIKRVKEKLKSYRASVKCKRTCSLWFQYMDMIDILQRFIKAERMGDWALHLQTLAQMLPYFVASGHNLYAKSARLYLQCMMQLETTHPEVFQSFTKGCHVVRRSDRFWAGLATDLVIEQVLMRSIKTNGGLTRGRGMGETQRLTWLLSMPACASVNVAMQNVTSISFNTSEQHKDMTKARLCRDEKDIISLLEFLKDRNPFSDDSSLRNIVNGETADTSVNVDNAVQLGQNILNSMTDKGIQDFSFKKKDQAITLAAKSSVRINGELVEVDPQLLFQRLITTVENLGENLSSVLKHELCNVAPALFEPSGLPRQANKPAFATSLWNLLQKPMWKTPAANLSTQFVLDGGALLQRIVWPRGVTYNNILQLYVDYVLRRYGKASIVFDGYENGPSTKDITHLRRKSTVGGEVHFTTNMVLSTKKEDFVCNRSNKQRFINLLGQVLQEKGCKIKHANGDADLMIVQTAVESARDQVTVLIGEDTDLIVLLCYHAEEGSKELYFMAEQKSNSKKEQKIWKITEVRHMLGQDICRNILFSHALLGCDTTSRLFGIGKGVSLKKLKFNTHFKSQAAIFNKNSTAEEVIAAGEQALVIVYNGIPGTSLDSLRHIQFCEKVATSSRCVQPRNLPPTSSAAKYHSLRVYFQIREWMGNRPSDMLAQDWGWKLQNGCLFPIITDLPPAPLHLLQVIRCNCKCDCSSSRCTCRKHGLECSPGCGECRGLSCTNSPVVDLDDGMDDQFKISEEN